MIRFVLHPGYVISPNDGEWHKITAPMLARLYGVSMSECIVVDESRPETVLGRGDLKEYLHLFVSTYGAAYWEISDIERAQYPIKELSSPTPFYVAHGERRFAAFKTKLSQLVDLVRGS